MVLKSTKREALIDFISCFPDILSHSVSARAIKDGFLENGMIDKDSHSFPDFNAMLATCCRDPKIEEYEVCRNSFPSLLQHQLKHGHIPDKIFEATGLPKDRNYAGEEVRREATISQESFQWAKTLSHDFQVQLRAERCAFLRAEKERREAVVTTKILAILATNKQSEEKLLGLAPQPAINPNEPQESPLSFLSLEDFAKCKISLLKAFAHVRLFSGLSATKPWPSKKGTVQDALRGDDCYLLWAFNCRSKPVILKSPAPLDAEENGAGAAPNADAVPAQPLIASPTRLIVGYNTANSLEKAKDFFNVKFVSLSTV